MPGISQSLEGDQRRGAVRHLSFSAHLRDLVLNEARLFALVVAPPLGAEILEHTWKCEEPADSPHPIHLRSWGPAWNSPQNAAQGSSSKLRHAKQAEWTCHLACSTQFTSMNPNCLVELLSSLLWLANLSCPIRMLMHPKLEVNRRLPAVHSC